MNTPLKTEVAAFRTTVFVVGSDALSGQQLTSWLEASGIIDVEIGTSVSQVVSRLPRVASGVVLVDASTPAFLELVERMRAIPVSLPLIVLVESVEFDIVVRAFRSGVADVMQMPISEHLLIDRIVRAVYEDRHRISQRCLFWRVAELTGSLTPRELEVMRFVVEGSANKQIAADLGISEKTVEVHRHKVMQKMEADSLAELVRMNVVMESVRAGMELHN